MIGPPPARGDSRTMQVSQWAYGMLKKEKPVYVSRIGLDEALHHPLTVSNALLTDPEALRDRMQRDGYLYLRGILPTTQLDALRAAILAICHANGWVRRPRSVADATVRGTPVIEGQDEYFAVYDAVQRLESFHRLADEPVLIDIIRALVGEPVLVHPLKICRLMFPENEAYATPPHQDFPNNQGTPETYAIWIPLGGCTRRLGSIAVLEGSHRLGVLPMCEAVGAGLRATAPHPELDRLRWVSGDMAHGDILLFHSLTVHRSLPNRTPDQLRISVDYRYQNAQQPICEIALTPHYKRSTWEDIYATWRSTERQHYWRALPLQVTPFEPFALVDPPEWTTLVPAPDRTPRLRAALRRVSQLFARRSAPP
jgi:ectoine hydroxylase-related dioxygenase (phytanoyl-CoA dioxygenase family)